MSDAKTILIVDDDQTMCAGLETVLREKGYQTLSAEDGQEARELIEKKRPDLVILDMMMPRWGGFAVLEHFQNRPEAPHFIMITGSGGAKHKQYAEQIGVADYIRKPFPMERLLEGVTRCLGTPEKTDRAILRFRCSGCGARIKAPLKMRGETRSCPGCARLVIVHQEPPEDQGPLLLLGE